jgi:hypothetical protein
LLNPLAWLFLNTLDDRNKAQPFLTEVTMSDDITKLCADSLRAFTQNNHGITLKSSHAHELVAACFGYQSRAALLADNKFPIGNLRQAEFIVLNPPMPLIEQRRHNLEGLSPDLPQGHTLVEGVYSALVAEKWILEKVWPSFHDLAVHLAEQRLHKRLNMWQIDPKAIKLDMDVDIEHKEDGILLTVNAGSRTDAGERLKDSKYTTKLSRIAANLGYGEAKVSETRYSGNARKMDFPEINFPENETA